MLDCSGNSRASHLVKEWFARSRWVFVVYDIADPKSFDAATELLKDAKAAGANVVLFGNQFNVQEGAPPAIDIMKAKDCAVKAEGYALESKSLFEAVKMVLRNIDEENAAQEAEAQNPAQPDMEGSPGPE